MKKKQPYDIILDGKLQKEILKLMPISGEKERRLESPNILLFLVHHLLHGPKLCYKGYHLPQNKYRSLMKICHYIRNSGRSLDAFMDSQPYNDDIKELIAKSLAAFEEVCILFRVSCFANYDEKSKVLQKLPQSDYFEHAIKFGSKNKQGKKISHRSLIKKAKLFEKYLEINDIFNRGGNFYDIDKFCYLAILNAEISKIRKTGLTLEEKRRIDSPMTTTNESAFSIDKFLNDMDQQKREKRDWVGYVELPFITMQGSFKSEKL